MIAVLNKPEKPKTLDEAQSLIDHLWDVIVKQHAQLNTDSTNSSRPPSSDSPKARSKRNKRPPSDRAKGAQPGHKKHERALHPVEQARQVLMHYPHCHCDCGGDVQVDHEPALRHQVFDLPNVAAFFDEHQCFDGECTACHKRVKASFPDNVPQGQMGPNLVTTIAIMAGQYQMSFRQIQCYLQSQWGLSFSLGAISQSLDKANQALSELYLQIGDQVRQAPIAHADETRHYRRGTAYWLWVLCSEQWCFFMADSSRGMLAADVLLGEFDGVLVTDDYSGYNHVADEQRQLCFAHLIRHAEQISERQGEAGTLGKRLKVLLQSVVHTQHRFLAKELSDTQHQVQQSHLRGNIQSQLQQGEALAFAPKTAGQCRHWLKREPMMWTFLSDPAIPLTNNLAERRIRPAVIWRKTSHGTQSLQGDQFRVIILSIVATARAQGINVYEIVLASLKQWLHGMDVTIRFPEPPPLLRTS